MYKTKKEGEWLVDLVFKSQTLVVIWYLDPKYLDLIFKLKILVFV